MFMDQLEFPKNAWILGLFSLKTPFNFGSLYDTDHIAAENTMCRWSDSDSFMLDSAFEQNTHSTRA